MPNTVFFRIFYIKKIGRISGSHKPVSKPYLYYRQIFFKLAIIFKNFLNFFLCLLLACLFTCSQERSTGQKNSRVDCPAIFETRFFLVKIHGFQIPNIPDDVPLGFDWATLNNFFVGSVFPCKIFI